ncbi:MAG TPA: hypothetical protein DCM64_10840 [Gammaproteobacteria bacterium]|nr:hypothetical protein [Gammaproteobacteria bacterium]
MFGLDVLVRKDQSSVLVEINDRPNIVHTRLVNTQVNIPMVQAMYGVLDPEKNENKPATALRFELLAEL